MYKVCKLNVQATEVNKLVWKHGRSDYDDTHNMVSEMRTKMKEKKCECDEAEYWEE